MTRPGGLEVLWDDELRTEREPAREPSKVWRNWGLFSVFLTGRCNRCHKPVLCKPGDIYGGCCFVWPSKDAAETYAHEHPIYGVEYLGAFPEGEQPNNT